MNLFSDRQTEMAGLAGCLIIRNHKNEKSLMISERAVMRFDTDEELRGLLDAIAAGRRIERMGAERHYQKLVKSVKKMNAAVTKEEKREVE